MSAEITKIVLKIDEQDVELTPGQAKELRRILNDMYGENSKEYHFHYPPYEPPRRYWYWSQPCVRYCSETFAKTTPGNTLLLTANS